MLSRRRLLQGAALGTVATAVSGLMPSAARAAILAGSSVVDRNVDAVTFDGKSITLKQAELQELGESLRGNLLLAGHTSYEQARRVWNAQLDRRPALIVQPRGAADVKNAIDFARAQRLMLAVKCGGHSPSGKSTTEKGLLIDLSLLRGVRVDAKSRIARVAGGSLLGDLDQEAMAQSLVTTAGTVSHTGVGGLTLGGGFGRVARRFGLALDNVRAVEVVTGTGEIVRASAEENPELLWGTRGGSGNFGVVTGFDFDLHPMQRQVLGGTLLFPLSQAKQVLKFWSEYEAVAPDEMYISGVIGSNIAFSGNSGVGFSICYSGPESNWEKILKTVRSPGKALIDSMRPVDYVALQRSGDGDEKRAIGSYTKTGFVKSIPPALVDAMVSGLVGASRAVDHRRLPALRWRHLAHRAGCDRVPAPEHPCHLPARRRLAGRRGSDPAHRVVAQILGQHRAAHRGLLHERRRQRDAAAGGRELPRQLLAAGAAQEQVRPAQSLPAERQRAADRLNRRVRRVSRCSRE